MEKMSLKVFWETVEQRLAESSAEELRAMLRAMADQVVPSERQVFVEKLKPPKTSDQSVRPIVAGDLLDEIDDLVQELEAEMQDAEYAEEEHGWSEYAEEDALGPYANFVESFTALFEQAQAAFESGDLILARDAFQKLFEAQQIQDDYGRGVSAEDLTIDIAEQSARFLRAVYETASLAERPQVLFEQLRRVRAWVQSLRPTLNDIIEISVTPLPDYEHFLAAWVAFLRAQNGKDADAWLREAVQLVAGTTGLEQLARTEGIQRPRAYLDWLTALEKEERWQQVLAAAPEALTVLPARLPIRAAIADHWGTAAAKLNENEILHIARWEAFAAQPALTRLLDLWDVTPAPEERDVQMWRAAQYLTECLAQPFEHAASPLADASWERDFLEQQVPVHKSTLAHAYLLAGAWEHAHRLAASDKVLGWSGSDNAQGLVLSVLLVLLSRQSMKELPPNLAQLVMQSLQNSLGYSPAMTIHPGTEKTDTRLERAYGERLARAELTKDERETFRAWCLDVAQRRANAIVSGQHRKSYDKAAQLVAACAEVLQSESPTEANAFVSGVRQRFPRHSAFQAELKTALQRTAHARR